jgi:hypothetical protein
MNLQVEAVAKANILILKGLNMKTYNGYKNYETWNVALWIGGDEGLYNMAKEFDDYESYRDSLREVDFIETPDKVSLNDSGLDIDALNEVIAEIE